MDRPRSPSIPRPANANGQDRSASPLWDESPSPRYRSPSRGRPRSFHGTPRERSYSRSTSRSSSSSRSRKAHGKSHDDNHHGLFKTSAGLLAGIGVATFLAHKVWPKGILYGDLEDWACKQPEPKRRPPPQRRISDPQRVPRRNPRDGRDGRDGQPPRVIERVRERGNVVYREEIVPVRKGDGRRRDLEARGFERMGRPGDRERQPPPYPDRAYPDERFYGPSSSRVRPGEPVYR